MFGSRLKSLRISNKYSMDQLVDLYNDRFNGKMNKSTLSRYENGLQDPIYTVVVNLAKLFEVSVDYMTCTDKYCDPDNILETYYSLDMEDRLEVRGVIKYKLTDKKYQKKENLA